ncbi:hypothetical protein BDV12DRAFT_12523 [Aspergillus spectabilis]
MLNPQLSSAHLLDEHMTLTSAASSAINPLLYILNVISIMSYILSNLPLELILHMVGFLDYKSEINAYSRCSREL